MPRPKPRKFDLKEKVARIIASGFVACDPVADAVDMNPDDLLLPLPDRIRLLLNILRDKPQKSTSMNYLILYDIENNKIRRLISKYLVQKGCVRVQKSVFLCHTDHIEFEDIKQTLADINEAYDNSDSIILVPMNISDARSMKLIGKNVNIAQIVDPPNTVFL